jgi:hypothetical protein
MDGAKLVVASLWMSLIAVSAHADVYQSGEVSDAGVSVKSTRQPFSFKALRAKKASLRAQASSGSASSYSVSDDSSYGNNSLSGKLNRKLEYSPTQISLVIPSFVVHGMKPTNNASEDMPRKMDGDGRSVVTPGFGLEYRGPTGFLAIGAVIKDCYDNLAGTLQFGQNYELSDRVNFGVTMGVYARQTPYSCETYQEGRQMVTDCQQLDNYNWKFMSSVNGHDVDIIPMPFLHLSVAVFKSRYANVDLKVMSNFLLNEVGVGIPF